MNKLKIVLSLIVVLGYIVTYSQSYYDPEEDCNDSSLPGFLYNADFKVCKFDGGDEFAKDSVCGWGSFDNDTIGINSQPSVVYATMADVTDTVAQLVLTNVSGSGYTRKDAIITPIPNGYLINDTSYYYFCQVRVDTLEYSLRNYLSFKAYWGFDDGQGGIDTEDILDLDINTITGPAIHEWRFYNSEEGFYKFLDGVQPDYFILSPYYSADSTRSDTILVKEVKFDFIDGCDFEEEDCPTTCESGQIKNSGFEKSVDFIDFGPPYYGNEIGYGCSCGWEVFSGECHIREHHSPNLCALISGEVENKLATQIHVEDSIEYTLEFDYVLSCNDSTTNYIRYLYVRFADSLGNLYPNPDTSYAAYQIQISHSDSGRIWRRDLTLNLYKPDTEAIIDRLVLYVGESSGGTAHLMLDNISFRVTDSIPPVSNLDFEPNACPGNSDFELEFTGSDVRPTSFDIYFGDGESYNNSTHNYVFSHEYSNFSHYPITYSIITVLNYTFCNDTLNDEIIVWPNPDLHATPQNIIEGTRVYFRYETYISDSIDVVELSVDNTIFYTDDVGDPTFSFSDVYYDFNEPGDYSIRLDVTYDTDGDPLTCSDIVEITVCSDECIIPFAPFTGNSYIVSGWVKQEVSAPQLIYDKPEILVSFNTSADSTINLSPLSPSGNIIEGWQRIYGEILIPSNAIDITVSLLNSSSSDTCYFDDIRIFPFEGNMKSYVYNPYNLWFLSELDENNYASFYEYDEEGKLVRVKKETEKGIVTISESRNNIIKSKLLEE